MNGAIREIVRAADPSMPAGRLQTLEGEVDRVLAPRTARFALVAVFAGAAIVLHAIGLAAVGAVIGVGVAMAAGRAASSMIFGIRPHDPLTHIATVVGVTVIVLAACYVPGQARRGG